MDYITIKGKKYPGKYREEKGQKEEHVLPRITKYMKEKKMEGGSVFTPTKKSISHAKHEALESKKKEAKENRTDKSKVRRFGPLAGIVESHSKTKQYKRWPKGL